MFYRSSRIAPTTRRPGVVLLVVMAMLALFASLALSFVFYADNEAVSASNSVAAQTNFAPDIDPEVLLGYFLNKLIYDTNNPYSAGRGGSLSRSMYGYNPAVLNFTPYNGIGRIKGNTVSFGAANIDYFNLTNYQQYSAPPWNGTTTYAVGNLVVSGANSYLCIQANTGMAVTNTAFWQVQPVDPLLNQVRAPEFYGKQSDGATYRYVGGANPPWTAYDTNSLFLAEMTADGTVLMPSFSRPWNAAGTAGTAAARYVSMSPDPTWNPAFSLSDMDASGRHVKNLDIGTGMNDSYWMDWGFPIMTAPNGKRYKPMFAPLIVDMSNKLHLWAHGNNLPAGGSTTSSPGGSNQGFGPPEVNLNALPGVRIPIAAVSETKKGVVTVTTAAPHGLKTGQKVMIAGVNVAGYDGTYTITIPATNPTMTFTYPDTKGLAALPNAAVPIANGYVYNLTAGSSPLLELQALFALRYGPGGQASGPVPNIRPGTWFSPINASGLDQSAATSPTYNTSSAPPYMSAPQVWMTKAVASAGSHTVTVSQISSTVPPPSTVPPLLLAPPTPFPWALQVGMGVTVLDPVNVEPNPVTVTAVNYGTSSFTATFAKKHPAGTPITFGTPPSFGFPTYPQSWGNASPAELTNNPLAFNLFLPNAPNIAPLQMSNQEALMRWGGTNAPALTSGIFQRMPTTFSNMRARNMVTLANWNLDRVTSAPYLNFNRNSAQTEYSYISGMSYPVVGNNEIQNVLVTGPTNGTFTLTLPGQKATAKITLSNKLKNTTIQKDLNATLPAGGTAAVGPITINAAATPPTYSFTVSFGGTLSNLDVPQLTGTGLTGTPLPQVIVTTVKNGTSLFAAPNFGLVPLQTPTPNSDYTADWRSTVSQALRVDLTRPLTEYPPVNAAGMIDTTVPQYSRAVQDRQQFARDLYNALVRVTGARDPNLAANAGMQLTAPDYQAARWLAQLAVNIVDYIDDDDYMTPFNWYPQATATVNSPEGWVFGTELPRLVLNEAYAQQEATGQVNIWAEMFNPFKSYAAGTYAWWPGDNGSAILQQAGNIPYIIEIHNKDSAFTAAMQGPANPTGFVANPLSVQGSWGATQTVLPANGATSSLVVKNISAAKHNAKGQVTITVAAPGHGLTPGGTSPDIGKPVTIVNVSVPAYNGTFLISKVPSTTTFDYIDPSATTASVPPAPAGGTATYGGNPASTTALLDQAMGFYVIGPVTAASLYGTSPRNPDLLATYLAPVVANTAKVPGQGMSFTNAPLNINPLTAKANTTGVTHNGTTVTVNLTAATPLPVTAAVGDQVVIQNVVTAPVVKGVLGAPTPAVFNNTTAGNPSNWAITSINAARTSFTFTYTGTAPLPGAGTESGNGTVAVQIPIVTLQMRRLANPHLPLQATPGAANYNPYVTVDSLDITTTNAAPAPAVSFGRTQPYAASTNAQMANTFFSQNVSGTPFDWLVHLDRPPVNPMELLHVSGYRPHELTQQFVTSTGGKFQHYAPWNPFASSASTSTLTMADPNALIYRALDQMSTRYMAGLKTGSRFPGNINLNTITEFEIFQALCDAHDATAQYPNAWFTQQDVASIFIKLIAAREGGQFLTGTTTTGSTNVTGLSTVPPGGAPNTPQPGSLVFGFGIPPGATVAAANPATNSFSLSAATAATGNNLLYFINPTSGTPFKSFSAASTSASGNQVSLNDTWFRPDPTNVTRPLFAVPQAAPINPNAHPYWQSSLLQKIYNNITTTSNVFAVWWTVGYFEVVDETVKPARLGQEIGRAQNRHIRHRFFAIVDRSGLQLFPAAKCPAVTASPTPQTVTLATPLSGTIGTAPVQFQPGMLLEIDSGTPAAEVVAVMPTPAPTASSFTAVFTQTHAANASIICRGNPGPQTTYNPHDDRGVVLHMSVIK